MGDDFVTLLLKWFDAHGRDLPWRHTTDPYAIWLSEVILQQTRIAQGTDYWWRFMRCWPTVADLASATEDEVLRMWQGLGYYSRARHLHAAARQIVAMGGFPTDYDDIRRLQGVGDYTAAAVASFAYGQPRAVVDGNVYRVLARYEGIDEPINSTAGRHLFAALAQQHMDSIGRAGEVCGRYNQAIMDFGALQCTPKSAPCLVCPLAETCVACRTGRVGTLPVKLRTTRVKPRYMAYIYKRWNAMVAFHQRGSGDIWQGLWEPLCEEYPTMEALEARRGAGRLLRRHVRHVLTHRIIVADFYLDERTTQPRLPEGYMWIAESDLDRYALPRLVELLVGAVEEEKNEMKERRTSHHAKTICRP